MVLNGHIRVYMFLLFGKIISAGVGAQFRYSKCSQEENEAIVCDEAPHKLDDTIATSQWPPGPYILPMTIHGCPESWQQGWESGVLSITWATSQAVYVTNSTLSTGNHDKYYDVALTKWPGFQTSVFGPFQDLEFKLKFCYKHESGDSNGVSKEWPKGEYNIYGTNNSCPRGFKTEEQSVSLPKISHWYTDGYTPEINIEERDNSTWLRVNICTKVSQNTNGGNDDMKSNVTASSYFALIQAPGAGCPSFTRTTVQEERFFIGQRHQTDNSPLNLFETYCFYQPKIGEDIVDKLLDTKNKEGYIISTATVTDGYQKDANMQDPSANPDKFLQMLYRTGIPWKMIDIGSSIPVSAIDLQLSDVTSTNLENDEPSLRCFMSEVRWSFLHFDATDCTFHYKQQLNTLHLLFTRVMYGRYITLVDDTHDKSFLRNVNDIQVFTYITAEENNGMCNSDLGMADGSILDFQISASSSHTLYPPSNARPLSTGWCASSNDKEPFIMVDLLAIVRVDGLTIAKREVSLDSKYVYVYTLGSKSIQISYGTSKDELYQTKVYHLDVSLQEAEILFLNPLKARYVKIKVLEGLMEGLTCLRFELHGCKLSGVPSLRCEPAGTMFDQLSMLPLPVTEPTVFENVSTFNACRKSCEEKEECSSVRFEESSICTEYNVDKTDKWMISPFSETSSQTSAKLCWENGFTVARSRMKQTSSGIELFNHVAEVHKESVITNVGYPLSYGGGLSYKWIIFFEDDNYVKLVFTNISFHLFAKNESSCEDNLMISKYLAADPGSARRITNRFNGQIFYVETSETTVVLTFSSCIPLAKMERNGYGFRAIVTKQNIPACFSLNSKTTWKESRSETCSGHTMLIKPMSSLGIPFEGTTEQWKLYFPRFRIELHVTEFKVECLVDSKGSVFYILDLNRKYVYCNLNMPPSKMSLSSDNITIYFYKDINPRPRVYSEGFVLTYNLRGDDSFAVSGNRSEVSNVALGKPTVASSVYGVSRSKGVSSGVTDGIVHADMIYGSCFHSKNEFNPWVLIDLQGEYTLHWIELYMRMDCCGDGRSSNGEISTGLETRSMAFASFICGRVGPVRSVNMKNILARFIKYEQLYTKDLINMCEMKVFGKLVGNVDTSSYMLQKPQPVDGQWGGWGSWSPVCYCNATRPRRRACDSPSPYFSGQPCIGSNTSYTICVPEDDCSIENFARGKSANMSSLYLSHTADLGIDGDSTTCFHTEYDYQPWWLVDLREVYYLHHIVMYDFITNATRTRSIEVTTGLTRCNMTSVYFKCGEPMYQNVKTIDLLGSVARYVKVQMMGIKEFLQLCEVEIYGQKSREESFEDYCADQESIDGKWSSWSSWTKCSEDCGTGNRTRTRTCTEPAPANGGKHCIEGDLEIISCRGSGNCPYCKEEFGKCYSLFPQLTNWRHGGEECWYRGMSLVSIRSKAELKFIKSLLRENRYVDNQPIPDNEKLELHINASYFTHIGLRRNYRSDYGVKYDVWENNSPVTFTAWNIGEPSEGNCTRMNYRLYDVDNSWESEDCEGQLAEYFVCERRIEAVSERKQIYLPQKEKWVMIPEQVPVNEYKGKVNTTLDGLPCTSWANVKEKMFNNTMFPERSMVTAENYCRDPTDSKYLWCYTVEEASVTRKECDIIMPAKNTTFNGYLKYVGTLNTTFSGKTCQKWASNSPHSQFAHGFDFPGESIASVDNYCRDPWGSGYLWCYTTDQGTRWEPCVLKDTKEDGLGIVYRKYSGSLSQTYTGKSCQPWNRYLNGRLGGNYCDDPLNQGFLWCYIYGGDWEPCSVTDGTAKKIIEKHNTFEDSSSKTVFTCKSGQTIPKSRKCDARFDCLDNSDETDCWKNYKPHRLVSGMTLSSELPPGFDTGSHFLCFKTYEWISITAYCDGVIDCLDSSDEINCDKSCSPDQYRCGEGDCIHISQLCNFVPDCIDRTDENCDFRACANTEYQCDNGQCIPLYKRCDSNHDCYDGSDELICDTCETKQAFHCDVARCIPARLRCDNYMDCEDGTDEADCAEKKYVSCDEWWEHGYRTSSQYLVGGLKVICDFDSIVSTGKIYTIVENRDIVFDFECCVVVKNFLLSKIEEGKEGFSVERLVKRPGYTCKQEIKQTCHPSHAEAAILDDPHNNHIYEHCECVILEVTINTENRIEKSCLDTRNGFETTGNMSTSTQSKLTFSYKERDVYRSMAFLDTYTENIELFPGPIRCVHDFSPKEETLTCGGEGKVIPANRRCLYDVDDTKTALDCRSGSHLENCETFKCLNDTVKCPGSYCLPLKFICDGTPQCPGGQDEENCGCSDEDSEILIIYHHFDLFQQHLDVEKFADQLYTKKATVRILSYTASQPLNHDYHIDNFVMHIKETSNLPFSSVNRLPEYRYKLLADTFLQDILLTKNSSSKRSIVFLENSMIAKSVARQLFSSLFEKLPSDVNVYRVIEDPTSSVGDAFNFYDYVLDVSVKRWHSLNTLGTQLFPSICAVSTKVECPNAYRCAWSRNCIPLDQVCDGHTQCYHGDDERLCKFHCPNKCQCRGYAVFCGNKNITLHSVSNTSNPIRYLDLSRNANLARVLERSHLMFPSLAILNLSWCHIEIISNAAFRRVFNIYTFDLSYNDIKILPANVFSELTHLRILELKGNYKLANIEAGAFNGLRLISKLNLADGQLKKVAGYLFAGLKLDVIDLSNNTIEEIEAYAFSDVSVSKIHFDGNKILSFNKEIFTGVSSLTKLKTPAFKFCCIRPNYLEEEECFPPKDEFSSCEDLMRLSALQTMLWLIGMAALIGNGLTILYRVIYDRRRLRIGYGIFVTNLAVADFLMGIYLIIIAIADAMFRKRYIFMDEYWRSSVWCSLAGFLSTVSSEASVFFLCLITIDRLLMIKFPFRHIRMNWRIASHLSIIAWIVSITIAVIPFVFKRYFQDKFYTKSGVCIALPLTGDHAPGWLYSVAIFVVLNFLTFIFIAFGQMAIFMEFRKVNMEKIQLTSRKQELTIARNLLLVVTTDFLCWFPIGVMGMMALNGHVISGDVYAWAAVFILPVNSALNPILYTLSAIVGQRRANTNADELSRSKVSEYVGGRSLAILEISKNFSTRIRPGYKSIADILEIKTDLSAVDILEIASRLASVLDVVHENSLGVGRLNCDTIHVNIKETKMNGQIKIQMKPQMLSDKVDSHDDMYQYGKVLRALVAQYFRLGNGN